MNRAISAMIANLQHSSKPDWVPAGQVIGFETGSN